MLVGALDHGQSVQHSNRIQVHVAELMAADIDCIVSFCNIDCFSCVIVLHLVHTLSPIRCWQV